jgi:hypothetical protein
LRSDAEDIVFAAMAYGREARACEVDGEKEQREAKLGDKLCESRPGANGALRKGGCTGAEGARQEARGESRRGAGFLQTRARWRARAGEKGVGLQGHVCCKTTGAGVEDIGGRDAKGQREAVLPT